MSEPLAATITVATQAGRNRRKSPRGLLKSPIGMLSACWLAALIAACALAPLLPLADPLKQDLAHAFETPTAQHLLGTDSVGRDILARILDAGQTALLGAALATLIALVIGSAFGVVAGYTGRTFDAIASWVADLLFGLPAIVILLAVAAVAGSNVWVSMSVFGFLLTASYFRLAQASTRSVRRELYIDAARTSGFGSVHIVGREIVPNVLGPLIVQSTITFGAALLVQAVLGFLGLGAQPPAADWGAMVSDASRYLVRQPWLIVPSGLVLALTIIAANLLGDALREGDGKARRFSMLRRAAAEVSAPTERRSETTAGTTRADDDALLSVTDLVVGFPDDDGERTEVVRGVGFDVARGEIVGLVGESGSGKTMTALSVLGLLPYPGRVTGGSITFDGVDLVAAGESTMKSIRGRRIGMISQEPMVALDPSFTVASQLLPPLRAHRSLGRADARRSALSLLADVGLPDPEAVMKKYPFQLSGGMAQRVAIAIALAGEPDLLIADEPTTALDVTVQAGILDLLRSIRDRTGMGMIFVTHDLGVVADVCDRVVVMERGQVVEQAEVDALFSRPEHPYTQNLIRSTPSLLAAEGAL